MTYPARIQPGQLLLLTSVFAFALSMSACGRHEATTQTTYAQEATSASHDAHADHTAPILPAGKLWPTDEPLRAAMTRIGDAVEHSEPAYANGSFTSKDAQELAERVESDVRYMIENCKLAPEPDAALHVLIARMMSAAAALQSDPNSPEGVPELAAVVRDYRMTFDHADEHAH